MRKDAASDRLKRDLYVLLDEIRADFDRIEILIAALHGFSRPIPDYESGFRNLQHFKLNEHELGRPGYR